MRIRRPDSVEGLEYPATLAASTRFNPPRTTPSTNAACFSVKPSIPLKHPKPTNPTTPQNRSTSPASGNAPSANFATVCYDDPQTTADAPSSAFYALDLQTPQHQHLTRRKKPKPTETHAPLTHPSKQCILTLPPPLWADGTQQKPQKTNNMKAAALILLLAMDAAALSQLPLSLWEAVTVGTLYIITAAQLWHHLANH